MKKVLFLILAVTAMTGLVYASEAENASDPEVTALPMRFISSVPGDQVFEAIKKHKRFDKLSKELPGSPIALRATMETRNTAGGSAAGFASAILAGSSLGLLPVVTNEDLVLRYEILVNGSVVSDFIYVENFTNAVNIYAGPQRDELDKHVLAWALTTVDEFLASLEADEGIKALESEYNFYFGEENKTVAKN